MKRHYLPLATLAMLLLCASTALGQGRLSATLNTGVGNGERLLTSFHLGGEVHYNILPYLGILVRGETYQVATRFQHNRAIQVLSGDGTSTLALPLSEDEGRFGMLRFYGVGVVFSPMGIVNPESRHIARIAGGAGFAHAYSAETSAPNQILHYYGSTGIGYFASVGYRYRITDHLALGGFAGILSANALQFNVGVSCSIEL